MPPAALPVFLCRLVHRLASVDSNISMRLCTKQTIATPGETQAVLQGAVQQNALREMAAVVELGARRVPEVHAEGGPQPMLLTPRARAKSGRRGAYSSA